MPACKSNQSTRVRIKAERASRKRAAAAATRTRLVETTATPILKPPRTVDYSALSLFEWIQNERIEMHAPHHRGLIWGEEKEAALIGAIIDNFPIAPIVFSVKRGGNGMETRRCVDGKQRLTAIYRFMLGSIPYEDVTNKLYFGRALPVSLKNAFKNKAITCVEYEDLTAEQEREIFRRAHL